MTVERPGYARRYTAPTRLRHVRQLLADRTERRTSKDILYLAYASILTAGIIGYPTVYAIWTNLAVPVSAQDLATTLIDRPVISACLGVLVMAGAVVIGRFRGPVVPPMPYLTLVVGSPIPRRLALRRRWLQSVVVAVIVTCAAAVVAVVVLAQVSALSGVGVAVMLVAALPMGTVLSGLWLAGQLGGRWRRHVTAGLMLVAAGLVASVVTRSLTDVALWSGPWGWAVVLGDSLVTGVDVTTWLGLGLLTVTAVLVAAWGLRVLDRLTAPTMADQSRRWNAAHTLAMTGDVRAAAGRLRPVPRWGRRWRIRFGSRPSLALLRRDLLGLARSWGWTLFSGVGLIVGSAAVAYSTGPFGAHTLVPYVAAIIVYLGVGGITGGLRGMADLTGSPSHFGIGHRSLLAWHAVVPALASAGVAGLTGLVIGVTTPEVASGVAVTWCALVAMFCVLLNGLSALKGPLPAEYLSPVPSPLGDFSGVLVLMWLSDAVIVAIAVIGTLTARIALGHGATASLTWLAVAAVVALMWARSRLDRHLSPQG